MHQLTSLILAAMVILGFQAHAAVPPYLIEIEGGAVSFGVEEAVVPANATVQWKNSTGTHHTITQDTCVRGGPCLFDSGVIPPAGRFEVAGLPRGRYPYHCQVHPVMRGTLIVTETQSTSAPQP